MKFKDFYNNSLDEKCNTHKTEKTKNDDKSELKDKKELEETKENPVL